MGSGLGAHARGRSRGPLARGRRDRPSRTGPDRALPGSALRTAALRRRRSRAHRSLPPLRRRAGRAPRARRARALRRRAGALAPLLRAAIQHRLGRRSARPPRKQPAGTGRIPRRGAHRDVASALLPLRPLALRPCGRRPPRRARLRARPWPSSPAAVIAAVILAAGASERFGAVKQRILLGPVLERVRASSVDACVVVLGAHEVETNARIVRCDTWEQGPGASLRCGLEALPAEAEAAVIVLADGPFISPLAIDRVI